MDRMSKEWGEERAQQVQQPALQSQCQPVWKHQPVFAYRQVWLPARPGRVPHTPVRQTRQPRQTSSDNSGACYGLRKDRGQSWTSSGFAWSLNINPPETLGPCAARQRANSSVAAGFLRMFAPVLCWLHSQCLPPPSVRIARSPCRSKNMPRQLASFCSVEVG